MLYYILCYVMWVHFATAWSVLGLQMQETASRVGG